MAESSSQATGLANEPTPDPQPTDEPTPDPQPTDPWPEAVADAIADSVASVRAIVLRPVSRVARWLVYGFILVVLALLVLALGLIGLIRLLDAYIPQEVWLTYAILGGIFTLAGLALWKRRPRGAAS